MKRVIIYLTLITAMLTGNGRTEFPLSIFSYFTDDEVAGGGPFVFNEDERRDVMFNFEDNYWGGIIQTNGFFSSSEYGCPEFHSTVWLMMTENGEVNYPELNECTEDQVFLGSPPLDTVQVIPFSSINTEALIYNADHEFDATIKMNWNPDSAHRDTLIMTEIVFHPDEHVSVNQWWYLMPPNLNAWAGGIANPVSSDLDGYNPFDPPYCDDPNDLRTCDIYDEAMNNYHAKWVSSSGSDSLMNPTIRGTHGFHHFDFEPTVENIIPGYPLDIYPDGPTVIYVKGGPVRVKGAYSGQFTIVTDEFTPYRRHAWPSNATAPLDTIWCNIWITDDLMKADSPSNGDLSGIQPDDDCTGGSENIMGLVSGANVFIANTLENGAGNNTSGHVIVHAHITALNESFGIHYWQNTLDNGYSDPPYGDGRGPEIYGGTTGSSDLRGSLVHWGGVVQKYRGYMERNMPGPYNAYPGIGMSKDFHYDANLDCITPPYYPVVDVNFLEIENIGKLKDYKLSYAYPNPFNPTTTIEYDVPEQSHITLTVYDIMGRLVKELVNKHSMVGKHSIIWNGTDTHNNPVASGMYLYQLKSTTFVETKKLVLLK